MSDTQWFGDEDLDTGGLMRCCTSTWRIEMGSDRTWEDGDIIQCHHSDDPSHRMIRRDGVWGWDYDDER